MSKICVIGTWHQASVISACFADAGQIVFGVGNNQSEIDSLNAAIPLVNEPKLRAIMHSLNVGRLKYTTNYSQAELLKVPISPTSRLTRRSVRTMNPFCATSQKTGICGYESLRDIRSA